MDPMPRERLLQHGDSPAALAAGLGKLGNGQGPVR